MRHLACIAIWGLLCLTTDAAEKVRTWTDAQGRTMHAEFVREVDGDVTFVKDGKLVTLPLDRFCEADKRVIAELQAAEAGATDAPSRRNAPGTREAVVGPGAEARPPTTTKKKEVAVGSRVWTDLQGNQTTAKFVRVFQENVVLLRGGRTLTLAYNSLSSVDQEYVKEVLIARGEEALIPQPAASAPDSAARPAEGEPGAPVAHPASEIVGPLTVAQPSATYDELHQRQDTERQELAAEHSDDVARGAAAVAAAIAADEAPQPAATESQAAAGARPLLNADTWSELKPVLIIGGVVVGVLGTVGVIVAVAITIASMNNTRRLRRYS